MLCWYKYFTLEPFSAMVFLYAAFHNNVIIRIFIAKIRAVTPTIPAYSSASNNSPIGACLNMIFPITKIYFKDTILIFKKFLDQQDQNQCLQCLLNLLHFCYWKWRYTTTTIYDICSTTSWVTWVLHKLPPTKNWSLYGIGSPAPASACASRVLSSKLAIHSFIICAPGNIVKALCIVAKLAAAVASVLTNLVA